MNAWQPTLVEYAMPSLGADMDEGTVIEWLVGPGDAFERGQVVARIETEKSDIDIEIWHDGTVVELVAEPGMTVPVGATLMHFHAASDTHTPASGPEPAADEVAPTVPADGPSERIEHPPSTDRPVVRPDGVVWATPLARRLAGQQGIELADVAGTGPQGAVRSTDLWPSADTSLAAVDERIDVDEASPIDRSTRMRSMIAARMDRSHREIPHYRLERNIDVGHLLEVLADTNERRTMTERLVPAAAFVFATARAAARHRELNGTWSDDRFHPGPGVNVSVAISLRGGGLVTPTISDADTLSLDATMAILRDFTTAARAGSMRSEWTAATSSITVTNLGDRGADVVHGLISPPEVALVGFGRIIERPTVVDGLVVARPVVTATLGADHRATDGAVGSRFLATLASTLEEFECQ